MSAEEVFTRSEAAALKENQIIARVAGKKKSAKRARLSAFSAGAFVTAMIVVFLVIFSSANYMIAAIPERLIEETDVQYADAVESKILVFQQALAAGTVPKNTIERLRQNGVKVGFKNEDGFTEAENGTALLIEGSMMEGDQIVTAGQFVAAVHGNTKLYNALNLATYSRAAYYYDEAATKVMQKIGTNRNNYNAETSFEETVGGVLGEGSAINVNGVTLEARTNEKGETYYEYATNGSAAESGTSGAEFVEAVRAKSRGSDATVAALNTGETLNIADTMAKEQRSSLYYLLFMENFSKTKAGHGNEAKINEMMNFLYHETESEVVDIKTGEVVTVKGSMLESPSLYAVLAGEKVDVNRVSNFASDRVIRTVENTVGAAATRTELSNAVTSTNGKQAKGSIGRLLNGSAAAEPATVATVAPTLQSSLVSNSITTLDGIAGGEFLVEGAVNVGKELAKASGATAGSAAAAKDYARATTTVLALDAAADRLNRSPFDITSKNTFLGSIVYKMSLAATEASSGVARFSSLGTAAALAVVELLPTTYADDDNLMYLTEFGDCPTIQSVGAVGSAGCSMVATFDMTTLNDTFNDPGFVAFVEANTTLGTNGVRTINKNSDLARFILYNDERATPVGVTDGGILESLSSGSASVPFLSDIAAMVKRFLGASEADKMIASGEAFVNSEANPDWAVYKYAQRYVSLARAAAALRQYDGDETAYNNIRFFEGAENPVVAFLKSYNSVAEK